MSAPGDRVVAVVRSRANNEYVAGQHADSTHQQQTASLYLDCTLGCSVEIRLGATSRDRSEML